MIYEKFFKENGHQSNTLGKAYSLKELKDISTECHKLHECRYLLIHHNKDGYVEFALVDFAWGPSVEGGDEFMSVVFHGAGIGDSLREMRHIWWGEEGEGYLYYPPMQAVADCVPILKEYFDFD